MDIPAAPVRYRSPFRWIVRVLVACAALVSLFIMLNVVGELRRLELPFVLPGAPLGTYAQTTQLNLLVYGLANSLFVLGAILVFVREGMAGRLLVVTGTIQLLFLAGHFPDATFPRSNLLWGFGLSVLPPLIIGGLLLRCGRQPAASTQRG